MSAKSGKQPVLFTPDQACVGIALSGRIGGGKSSFLRPIVGTLAERDVSILWCCIKPDEAEAAARLLAPFEPHLFRPGNGVFNPLTYELSRPGGSARNLSIIHDDLNEVLTRSDSEKTEPFWKSGTQETAAAAFELAYMVKGMEATYRDAYDIIMSIPVDPQHANSEAWRNTPCARFLNTALGKHPSRARSIADHLVKRVPSAGEKARGAFVMGAANSIQPMVNDPITQAVNGVSTITPEDMLKGHTILAFDTLTYGPNGLAFQLLCSWFCMEAVLRRTGDFGYFCLVRDEYQMLAHARRDVQTQSVGRSQRFIGVSAFQTLPVLKAALGGGVEAQTDADAVYGLHVNKVMVNNNDTSTNEANAMIIGQERKMFFGGSSPPQQELEWFDILGVGARPNFSFNQQWHYRVPPTAFLNLRTGGPENDWIVDAIIHRGSDGYERVSISQSDSMNSQTNRQPGSQDVPSGKDAIALVGRIFHLLVAVFGSFWAMIVKKPGTVGTRAYWFDASAGLVPLFVMSATPATPDRYLFQAALLSLPVLYFWHLLRTIRQPKHVHTKCVGASRFSGQGNTPELKELVLGGSIAVALYFLVEAHVFGVYLGLSVVANTLRDGMIEERDRQRALQMADAMADQEYMMANFDHFQGGDQQ